MPFDILSGVTTVCLCCLTLGVSKVPVGLRIISTSLFSGVVQRSRALPVLSRKTYNHIQTWRQIGETADPATDHEGQ